MKKILIQHNSPYSSRGSEPIPSSYQTKVLTFQELKSWVKSARVLIHLFRYREVVLQTYDLRLIGKPFLLALVTKLLSRGKCFWEDTRNVKVEVTFVRLLSLLNQLFVEFCKKPKFLKQLKRKITLLDSYEKNDCTLDLSKNPLYLRTDFCFGLQSGGSVTHIAGVFNNLKYFCKPPIFFSTDTIPTLETDIDPILVKPGNTFWNFSELPPFEYNNVFVRGVLELQHENQPAFVYQRYSLNNFSGLEIARHFGVPFVLEFNGSEIWVNRNWGSPLKYESLTQKIEDLNFKMAHLIVVISKPLKNELVRKGIESERILVNPNGVNPDLYSPKIDGSSVRNQYGFQKNQVVLGFIGTFGKWHGAEVLAEAFLKLLKKHPELKSRIRLMMIGDGITMPEVKKKLEKLVNEVVLTGTIPQALGPSHLAACDILVSPHVPNKDGSAFFGSPTKLFEYMAMGKGIVASNLDQIGEVLEHDKTAWLVEPGSSDQLMEGIKVLIDKETKRKKLGQKAREKAVSDFSWHIHTKKIINKLKELTNHP